MGQAACSRNESTSTGATASTRTDLGRLTPRARGYVGIDVFSDHNFWTGLTLDMSEGGVFVATHHLVPAGTVVLVNIELPGEDEPVVVMAQARWIRDCCDQDDVPAGIGFRFIDATEADLRKIRRFVANVREPLFFVD